MDNLMPKQTYSPPQHLSSESWVEFELRSALNLLGPMLGELKKLKLRLTKERVHKSRVSLRRWFSVWGLLADDGWEKKKFRKRVLKPLRKFLKELGSLRDCDVNIETAEKLSCDKSTLDDFKKERKKLKKQIDESLRKIDPEDLNHIIESYLSEQSVALTIKLHAAGEADHSAFSHFDKYASEHEKLVRDLSSRATTPDSLHKLRLAVKKWRYLLTECMGLTNLDLVRAQTLLGDIHDFDRLEPILKESKADNESLQRLRKERAKLVKEFESCKNDLPYGLRPGTISYSR